MAKQNVILGQHQPQPKVSQQALTGQLALDSDLSLCSTNLQLTISQDILQHKVQMLDAQMQELIDKKESHSLNVELLQNAIEKGEVEKVGSLLNSRIQQKLSNKEADQLMSLALVVQQDEILDVLTTSDKIDLQSLIFEKCKANLMFWAITHCKFDIANKLAQNSTVDIDATQCGQTVPNWIIHTVWRHPDSQDQAVELMQTLCNRGMNVNKNSIDQGIPINLAIKDQNWLIFNVLLNHKNINVNLPDGFGQTPIIAAIDSQNQEAFEALLNHKNIDVNLPNPKDGKTPLDYAVEHDRVEMVKGLLEKYPGKINSALLYVKSPEVLGLLLDNGADIHQPVRGESVEKRCKSSAKFQEQQKWFLEYQQSNCMNIKQADTFTLPDTHLVGESKSEEVHEGA
jgi:hypothetical protein